MSDEAAKPNGKPCLVPSHEDRADDEHLRMECLKLAVTRAAMIGSRNACKLAQSYFDYVTTGTVPADPEVIRPTMANSMATGLNSMNQLGQNYACQSAD